MICRQWAVVGDQRQCMTGPFSPISTLPRPVNYTDILRKVALRLDLFGNEMVLLPCVLDWYEANKQRCERQVEAEKLVRVFLEVLRSKL